MDDKVMTNREWQEEQTRMIEQGYITENGEPIKCFKCGSKKLKHGREWYLDGVILEEYEMRCAECDTMLGQWSHGCWQV